MSGGGERTFGAVVVQVELAVLLLLLPAHQVEGQVAVGGHRRSPAHHQLGGGVGEGARVLGHRRLWKRHRERGKICKEMQIKFARPMRNLSFGRLLVLPHNQISQHQCGTWEEGFGGVAVAVLEVNNSPRINHVR